MITKYDHSVSSKLFHKLQLSNSKIAISHTYTATPNLYLIQLQVHSSCRCLFHSHVAPTLQTRRGDEEDNRDGDGERRRDGRARVPHRVPQVRADRHPHHRVRLHAELRHQLAINNHYLPYTFKVLVSNKRKVRFLGLLLRGVKGSDSAAEI